MAESLSIERPRATDIVVAFSEVRERWPYAVAGSSRPNVIEFYLMRGAEQSDPPVATYCLESGRLCMADPTNAYRVTYPRQR